MAVAVGAVALVVAMSQFGSFTGLNETHSSFK